MTHTITLDKKTEDALERKARRLGVSTDELLVRLTAETVAAEDLVESKPKTGAELIEALRADGILTGYGDPTIDSVELARQLCDKAQ